MKTKRTEPRPYTAEEREQVERQLAGVYDELSRLVPNYYSPAFGGGAVGVEEHRQVGMRKVALEKERDWLRQALEFNCDPVHLRPVGASKPTIGIVNSGREPVPVAAAGEEE